MFERTAKGFVVHLDREEVEMIVRLVAELRDLLMADDPRAAHLVRRLFPPAYLQADDADAETEYQRLMREDLVASRLTAMDQLTTGLTSGTPMDEGTMHGLLQSLNAVRLVLGTLLDVSEDDDVNQLSDDDPMLGEYYLYNFLSFLLQEAVEALTT